MTESGIASRDDVAGLRADGVHAFLVGEAFMSAPDPGERLAALFGPSSIPDSVPGPDPDGPPE